jgi:hypothetical protein
MEDRNRYIKISPEVIKGDIFKVMYQNTDVYVYSSMTQILSGGTYNSETNQYDSLLTGLTIPILFTENTVDIGYYSVFDGMVLQKETMTNFLFSANTSEPYKYNFYNTSDTEFKKYLEFSSYKIDWGDNTSQQIITQNSPNFYSHPYPFTTTPKDYTITMSGMSPWGSNVVVKTVTVPFTNSVITNPKGTAYFIPAGGNWSGTPLMYDYIFNGDETCDVYPGETDPFSSSPLIISGYTKSSVKDLQVYGKKSDLTDGGYKLGIQVTGTSGVVGIYSGISRDGLNIGYSINNIDYYDYEDGTTIFVVSNVAPIETDCSIITKNEVLLNVIDEAEVQSNVFIDRGKQSGLERMERMGEIDNIGDLEKYGYGFFNIITI